MSSVTPIPNGLSDSYYFGRRDGGTSFQECLQRQMALLVPVLLRCQLEEMIWLIVLVLREVSAVTGIRWETAVAAFDSSFDPYELGTVPALAGAISARSMPSVVPVPRSAESLYRIPMKPTVPKQRNIWSICNDAAISGYV